jgi:hypothetical protein
MFIFAVAFFHIIVAVITIGKAYLRHRLWFAKWDNHEGHAYSWWVAGAETDTGALRLLPRWEHVLHCACSDAGISHDELQHMQGFIAVGITCSDAGVDSCRCHMVQFCTCALRPA